MMNTEITTTNHGSQNDSGSQNESGSRSYSNPERVRQTTFAPRFDIWEGDDEFVLYGDLPGVAAEDLEIEFENGQLTIHGKIHRSHGEESCLHSEYRLGEFHRSFMIGEAINSESIDAELRDGVLKLQLPKPEETKPRRIHVKAS